MACKRCSKKETKEEHWAKRGIKFPKPVEVVEEHTHEEDEPCEGCSEEE